MADKRSTVELIFQGVDRTGEATQAALRNAKSFTTTLQSATAPIADFTKKAVQVEAALLTAGAAITAFSIKAAGDFDAAFREISTLIDQPVEDLEGFRQAILDYSQTSTQPLEQITTAVYSAISAGVDYADSIEAVAQAEQLAVAGKADLNDTLTVLVSSLNAYGLEMDDAQRFSDALFTTVKQGQTTLPELGNSLAQVTGIAASAGVDFEELLSAVAALTAAGTPTSEAITSIRQAIANIINPTNQAQQKAAELGIEFNAAALETRGLSGVLDDVAEATGGNTEQMTQLFGSVQALGSVLTLTGEGADAFADTLSSMEGNAGATEEAFERMAGSVEQQNQRVVNALRGLAVEIGEPLLQEYGGVADALAAVLNSVGGSVRDGQLGDLVGVVEDILSDTEATLRAMAANMDDALELADLSGFERGIEALREGIDNLFQNQDLSTAEGLAQAMTTVADAFAGLSQFTAGVIESFQFFFDMLVKVGSGTASLDDELFRMLGNISGIVTQVDMLLPVFEKLLYVMIAAQGVGLVQGARQLTTAMGAGGLAGAIGKAGLVGAVAASVYEIGKLVSILWDWKGAADELAASQALANETIGRSETELQKVANDLGIAVDSYEDFWRMVEEGAIVADEASGKWVRASEKQREATEGLSRDYEAEVNAMTAADDMAVESKRKLSEAFAEQGLEWDAATGQIGDGKRATEEAAEAQERWRKTMEDGVATFEQVGPAFEGAMDGAKTSTEEVIEQSDKLRIGLEELASNERIRSMEFRAQINIAELEAQTAQVESAFSSIDNTVSSTGDLIGSLFSDLQGASRWDQTDIQRQIRKENERREAALERQNAWLDAQIEEIRARTEAMQRGDAMIQIDGAGLQPHLEAFMWEILRAIQVRVNQDGLDMLTGV